MKVHEHQVADKEGNGSRSRIEDQKTGAKWSSKDARADTETTFYAEDVNRLNVSQRRKRQLKRMLRLQEGEHVNSDDFDSRGQQNHKEDKRRLVCSFASQLELTGHQKERVKHIVMDVISVNSFGNYSTEEVILGVITYVCMEDMSFSGIHIDDRNDFHSLVTDVGTSMERVKRARQIMRTRIRE